MTLTDQVPGGIGVRLADRASRGTERGIYKAGARR
jgi:hypothetical protein